MADIIGGMFGVDPNQLQMQRLNNAYQQNMMMAQLNPFERANAQIANAASGATMLGARAMGLKTREEQVAENRQQIGQMVVDGKPSSYLKAAQAANQMGDAQLAQVLYAKAQELDEYGVDKAFKEAQTKKIKDAPLKVEWLPHPTDPNLEIMGQWSPEDQTYVPLEGERGRTRSRAGGGGGSDKPIVVTSKEGDVTVLNPGGTKVIAKYDAMGKPTATYEKDVNAKKKMVTDLDMLIPKLDDMTKKDGLLDQSTGSGIGAIADSAAGAVGYTTKGAKAIAELQPVADMVLKLVPRFEGPQSDKDTASYKEAAGNLADATKPIGVRKAAAKVLARLYRERRGQFEGGEAEKQASGNQEEWVRVNGKLQRK